ncbi:MAG: polysaccharide biosynthesis/export family protein, partial [Duncaniella sp.]|nr:polysaccharide biosynthesis/export family protein [Duncaniella sp.]
MKDFIKITPADNVAVAINPLAKGTVVTVDNDGDIDFPTLGKLHVAGLNRWGVAQMIKDELRSRELLRDAVVTVEFMNFKISVIGEVSRPGT